MKSTKESILKEINKELRKLPSEIKVRHLFNFAAE